MGLTWTVTVAYRDSLSRTPSWQENQPLTQGRFQSVNCTTLVQCGANSPRRLILAQPSSNVAGRVESPKSTRASVSFPTDVYHELERIAEAKKVSLAWVVREAAEKYVADQWPLLGSDRAGGRQ